MTEVTNCFGVLYAESDATVLMDFELRKSMSQLERMVNRNQRMVGWYATGSEITEYFKLIHQVYYMQSTNSEVLFLLVDVSLSVGDKLGIKAYLSRPLGIPGGTRGIVFVPLEVEIEFYAAERCAVEMMASAINPKNQLQPELGDDMLHLFHLSQNVISMLEQVITYVDDVLNGKRSADPTIGRILDGGPLISRRCWPWACAAGVVCGDFTGSFRRSHIGERCFSWCLSSFVIYPQHGSRRVLYLEDVYRLRLNWAWQTKEKTQGQKRPYWQSNIQSYCAEISEEKEAPSIYVHAVNNLAFYYKDPTVSGRMPEGLNMETMPLDAAKLLRDGLTEQAHKLCFGYAIETGFAEVQSHIENLAECRSHLYAWITQLSATGELVEQTSQLGFSSPKPSVGGISRLPIFWTAVIAESNGLLSRINKDLHYRQQILLNSVSHCLTAEGAYRLALLWRHLGSLIRWSAVTELTDHALETIRNLAQ
ncbi:translation initiation factor 3 subunit F [Clonorchis sinensis]|uniref:Translation initiation factor 3 subunit F n=1 Tax=Clonorchis sinensis TaxID=79923 RepID=G7YAI0_CLOSI|nr:translation initiation factor 3 subunit F [Clonorchis sinensis]